MIFSAGFNQMSLFFLVDVSILTSFMRLFIFKNYILRVTNKH